MAIPPVRHIPLIDIIYGRDACFPECFGAITTKSFGQFVQTSSRDISQMGSRMRGVRCSATLAVNERHLRARLF